MNEMNANAVETKEPENATASTPPKIIAEIHSDMPASPVFIS